MFFSGSLFFLFIIDLKYRRVCICFSSDFNVLINGVLSFDVINGDNRDVPTNDICLSIRVFDISNETIT